MFAGVDFDRLVLHGRRPDLARGLCQSSLTIKFSKGSRTVYEAFKLCFPWRSVRGNWYEWFEHAVRCSPVFRSQAGRDESKAGDRSQNPAEQ